MHRPHPQPCLPFKEPAVEDDPISFSRQPLTRKEKELYGEHGYRLATANYTVARPLRSRCEQKFRDTAVAVCMPRANGSVVYVTCDDEEVKWIIDDTLDKIQDQ